MLTQEEAVTMRGTTAQAKTTESMQHKRPTMRKAVGGVQEAAAQAVDDEVLRVQRVRIGSLPLLQQSRNDIS